jgi:hypothetical protein
MTDDQRPPDQPIRSYEEIIASETIVRWAGEIRRLLAEQITSDIRDPNVLKISAAAVTLAINDVDAICHSNGKYRQAVHLLTDKDR